MKIILLLFFPFFLLAQEYPYFTDKELNSLQSRDNMSKNRILDYEKQIHFFKTLTQDEQLKKVNLYCNRLQAQYDDITYKQEDNWATPKEFLALGYGDCEDYVLLKYYTLIKLRFDEKRLYLTVVKERFRGGIHMVLSYFKEQDKAPLILDNLSFMILPLHKRVDLQAIYFINKSGVYTIDASFKLTKVAQSYKEFEELKMKVRKNL
jgi:predicted transglutaminase-like cysteine proteinase